MHGNMLIGLNTDILSLALVYLLKTERDHQGMAFGDE